MEEFGIITLLKEHLTEQSFAFLIVTGFSVYLMKEIKFWKERCDKIQNIESARLKTYEDFMTRILEVLQKGKE